MITPALAAGKVVVLLGALVATYLLFAFASMRVALKTREVVVPTLAGRTVNEASTLLADYGLTLKVEDLQRIDPKVPAGRVMLRSTSCGVDPG